MVSCTLLWTIQPDFPRSSPFDDDHGNPTRVVVANRRSGHFGNRSLQHRGTGLSWGSLPCTLLDEVASVDQWLGDRTIPQAAGDLRFESGCKDKRVGVGYCTGRRNRPERLSKESAPRMQSNEHADISTEAMIDARLAMIEQRLELPLTDEQTEQVRRRIERSIELGDALRSVSLTNADAPEIAFEPYRRGDR